MCIANGVFMRMHTYACLGFVRELQKRGEFPHSLGTTGMSFGVGISIALSVKFKKMGVQNAFTANLCGVFFFLT